MKTIRGARLAEYASGEDLAAVLSCSWRAEGAAATLAPDRLEAAWRLSAQTGARGLLAHRLARQPGLAASWHRRCRAEIRQAGLEAIGHEADLCQTIRALRAGGVEPLLVKGWSVARLYSAMEMRPCGDIDLCVAPEQFAQAAGILKNMPGPSRNVDLHQGVADLQRPWPELLARSRLAPLGVDQVRILAAEDQLRHLCLHFVRHGGWRPLWLCDVAVALERAAGEFDWGLFLTGDATQTRWVECVVGLARQLLGARIAEAELVRRTPHVPDWLVRCVLQSWSNGGQSSDCISRSWRTYVRSAAGLRELVRSRWPNPIKAAFQLGLSPYTRMPIGGVRLAGFLARCLNWARRPLGGRSDVAAIEGDGFDIHRSG